jgi:hypothetical protein
MSKPIPKLAKLYQNQYQNRQNHIKTKIQDQNSKTSIGFGAYLIIVSYNFEEIGVINRYITLFQELIWNK